MQTNSKFRIELNRDICLKDDIHFLLSGMSTR